MLPSVLGLVFNGIILFKGVCLLSVLISIEASLMESFDGHSERLLPSDLMGLEELSGMMFASIGWRGWECAI